MTPPDLGGGERRSRRPRFFSSGFFALLLLFSSPFSHSTPNLKRLGDSDASFRVRSSAPLTYRAASELHRGSCLRLAVSTRLRSEVDEVLSINPKHRSESFSTTLPGPGFVELRSFNSQRFYTLVQLGKQCYWTSTCPLFPSPVVCNSQTLLNFPHTGICNHRLCLPRRDRYNFLRPIIPNIKTKFLVDVGVSHEIDGVPDFVGIVVLSPDLCYRRIGLFKQGDDSHRSMVSLTGSQVSVICSSLALGVLVNNLRSFEVAKSYKTRICSEVMPESHRKSEENPMAALSEVGNLGRTVPVGLGPVYASNGLYYQKGFNPSVKNPQKTNDRIELGFIFTYWVPVRCFISDIFCNVGLTSRRESLDSLNFII